MPATGTAAAITATVERIEGGWTGRLSNGKTAHITDGAAYWFADDFSRLSAQEDRALDGAAMAAIREGRGA